MRTLPSKVPIEWPVERIHDEVPIVPSVASFAIFPLAQVDRFQGRVTGTAATLPELDPVEEDDDFANRIKACSILTEHDIVKEASP